MCSALMAMYSSLHLQQHSLHLVQSQLYLQKHHEISTQFHQFMVFVRLRHIILVTVQHLSSYMINRTWSTALLDAVSFRKERSAIQLAVGKTCSSAESGIMLQYLDRTTVSMQPRMSKQIKQGHSPCSVKKPR